MTSCKCDPANTCDFVWWTNRISCAIRSILSVLKVVFMTFLETTDAIRLPKRLCVCEVSLLRHFKHIYTKDIWMNSCTVAAHRGRVMDNVCGGKAYVIWFQWHIWSHPVVLYVLSIIAIVNMCRVLWTVFIYKSSGDWGKPLCSCVLKCFLFALRGRMRVSDVGTLCNNIIASAVRIYVQFKSNH